MVTAGVLPMLTVPETRTMPSPTPGRDDCAPCGAATVATHPTATTAETVATINRVCMVTSLLTCAWGPTLFTGAGAPPPAPSRSRVTGRRPFDAPMLILTARGAPPPAPSR